MVRLGAWAQRFPSNCKTSCVFWIQEWKDFLSVCNFQIYKDGEGKSYGIQGGGSRSSGQHEGAGTFGGGFVVHRLLRTLGEALESAMRGDGGGAHGGEGQPVGRNHKTSPRIVDSCRMAKCLWISEARRGHGIKDRPIH